MDFDQSTVLAAGSDGTPPPDPSVLDGIVSDAMAGLMSRQKDDGHWVYELEADATIPAEYIMLRHFLDEPNPVLEEKIAVYLRRIQGEHGGWPLFYKGDFEISCSVKAYYALKLVGDDVNAPHMVRAREAIRAHGGAEKVNVFTRIALALFGQIPWRGVPFMPVEVMLLPKWFPFHMDKVSYWSRTVMVPLLILKALKPLARNPKGVGIGELFVTDPEEIEDWQENPTGSPVGEFFLWLDKVIRPMEPHIPEQLRARALNEAVRFVTERLNGEDGVGAIFPAMANTVMAFDALGYERDHPDFVTARDSIEKLLVVRDNWAYCQPCLSPVWDTSLAAHAAMEAGVPTDDDALQEAMTWLVDRQITDQYGDWMVNRPGVEGGGWAFQYRNDHYPDVDDTAVVGMALARAGNPAHQESIKRAAKWVEAMQSSNGGWGAFDTDNEHYYLNHIPFADHGALLDPPTADVSARCLSFLAQLGYEREHPVVTRGLDYLLSEQEEDGSWFGRWGTNYIYGTWSSLCALNALGEDPQAPHIRKAVAYLVQRQNADGGWGEDGASYEDERKYLCKASTPSQTAWALLALMAVGEVDHPAVRRGVRFLMEHEREGCEWKEKWFTAVGFPRVFYLRYHGYRSYFPLWALARYRNLTLSNSKEVAYGM